MLGKSTYYFKLRSISKAIISIFHFFSTSKNFLLQNTTVLFIIYTRNIKRQAYLSVFHEHILTRYSHVVHFEKAVVDGVVTQLRADVSDGYTCTQHRKLVSWNQYVKIA